jgi:hypothetical protein
METFYSYCQTLVLNCILYSDTLLTSPVSTGFQSDGVNCYQTDVDGKIIAITPCAVPCDLVISDVTSTDPTTLGGTDGTITITFSTSNGPSTYTLNTVPQGAAVSPLVVTGLSSGVEYTIEIIDSNSCSMSATLTLGQSAIYFDADWIMVTYEFTDGSDLDTRTRIAIPDIGQDTQPEYLGWGVLHQFPGVDTPIVTHGNDNTGTGFESVLVDVVRFKELFPLSTDFTVDLRAFWFGTLGTNPVIAGTTLWKGGTPVKNGCSNFCWTNPTADFTATIDSVPKTITLDTNLATTSGERVATLHYNLNTFVAVLDNNDITTPSV